MRRALIASTRASLSPAIREVLPEDEARRLQRALTIDTIETCNLVEADLRIYGEGAENGMRSEIRDREVRIQKEGSPGSRRLSAVMQTFAGGYVAVVCVETVYPTLPVAFIDAAFEALDQPLTIALGPGRGGGCYLIGMNDFFPSVFGAFDGGPSATFLSLLEGATGVGAAVTVLPEWQGIETPGDLKTFASTIDAKPAAAPHTREALRDLRERHPSIFM